MLAAALRLGGPGALRDPRAGLGGGIAAIVPTLDNAIFLSAVQTTLTEAGHDLLVASCDYYPDTELAVLRRLLARGVEGLILVGAQRPPAAWGLREAAGVPVVRRAPPVMRPPREPRPAGDPKRAP